MSERDKQIEQKLADDRLLDKVSYEAQRAILDPDMGGFRKDRIVEDAVTQISAIGERRGKYKSNKEGEDEPSVFDQINEYIKKEAPKDIENPTVEGIAERMGITGDVLNMWLKDDKQFREEMTRLKDFQINDPHKDGTEFDYFIHSSGVAFILDETKNRYTV